MKKTTKLNRFGALRRLINQYNYYKKFDCVLWPDKLRADGHMTECNFGGLLCMVSRDGDAVMIWRDWSDSAVSKLNKRPVFYTASGRAYVNFGGRVYLDQFMRVN